MKLFSLLFCGVFGMVLVACSPSATSHENVDTGTFATLMETHPEYIVLDVRTPEEWEQGMIEGAQGIDIKASDFTEQVSALDKDKTYLVYCRSGARSSRACTQMAEMGFSKLYNLEGGYLAWEER